tara:strand:+ start:671 stop:1906 length:1236 start_codon:yes stop_codon:yes gene_type:complete
MRFPSTFLILSALISANLGAEPWNLDELSNAPGFRWDDDQSQIRSLFYEGLPYQGKETEVFAFYGSPKTLGEDQDGPFPAVVLVHGGGGTAFAEWVNLWAKRGYAAIAMDLGGSRPPAPEFDPETGAFASHDGRSGRVRLENGGPHQSHAEKFQTAGGTIEDDWPYHAISNVIRAHSLIRGFKEVDPDRTAVTGISWGGYTTCIVASVDHRFKAAVPVYGCGFLYQGESVQRHSIDALGPAKRGTWIRLYDPSSHLPNCRIPIFFVNGTHDVHYPLDSYAKSYSLVSGPRSQRIEVKMGHSHPAGWKPKEIGMFIDSHCRNGTPLPEIGTPTLKNGIVSAAVKSSTAIETAQLHYTTDTGRRSKRTWQSVEADIKNGTITAGSLPEAATTWLLSVTDERGAMVSSEAMFGD